MVMSMSQKNSSNKANKGAEETDEGVMRSSVNQTKDSQTPALIEGSESPVGPSIQPQVAVIGGRRRGRRQVMKKKTLKDEEGYLGT